MNSLTQARPPYGRAKRAAPRTEIFLLLFLFVYPVIPLYLAIQIGSFPQVSAQRVLFIMLLLVWILDLMLLPSRRRAVFMVISDHKFLFVNLVLLYTWKTLSVFGAEDAVRSLYVLLDELALGFIFLFICLTAWSGQRQILRALIVMVISALIVSVIGIAEREVGSNLFSNIASYAPELDRLEISMINRYRDDSYRVTASFIHPLLLAQFIVIVLPITWAVIHVSKSATRILAIVTLVLMLAVVLNTGARSALVVLAVMGAGAYTILVFQKNKARVKKTFLMVLLPFVLLLFLYTTIWMAVTIIGVTGDEQLSTASRLNQIVYGFSIFMDAPFWGYGTGMSLNAAGFSSIDNYYFTIMLESGLPSLVFFIGLIYSTAKVGFQFRRKCDVNKSRLIMLSFIVCLLGISVFYTILSLAQNMVYLFIIVAMIIALDRADSAPISPRNRF